MYEDHPINKSQNDIILLIYKMWKVWDTIFVGNLLLSTSCKSSRWRHLHFEHSVLVQYFTHQYSFPTHRVLNSIASREKNKQVKQADIFQCQTLTFLLKHIFHIHLSIYPISVNKCLNAWCKNDAGFCLDIPNQQEIEPLANFLYQICFVGLMKHLSPFNGCILNLND